MRESTGFFRLEVNIYLFSTVQCIDYIGFSVTLSPQNMQTFLQSTAFCPNSFFVYSIYSLFFMSWDTNYSINQNPLGI